jgi:hypothetical protein
MFFSFLSFRCADIQDERITPSGAVSRKRNSEYFRIFTALRSFLAKPAFDISEYLCYNHGTEDASGRDPRSSQHAGAEGATKNSQAKRTGRGRIPGK